ncbi:MAG: glycosyltransferase family 4 protein [Deltaproteobacteria bacterium]|nr:glycosyltransferase family 4 protein [Deltaproteobacteria bacterium]
MIKVLHITAHVGGGVGKALSGLVARASVSGSGARHLIVCLEEPEKGQFVDRIRECGGEVIVRPGKDGTEKLLRDSDIVQLEWWNHPETIKQLCTLAIPPIRLLTWSHVSGIHNPIIPQGLMSASHRFLFTSPCSFESKEVIGLMPELGDRLDVVFSSGGFSGLPEPVEKPNKEISAGYIGSLNFAKLHPDYVDYLTAVDIPGFRVKMIGDAANQDILNQQCDSLGRTGMLDFRGYATDIVSELASINVLAYLLNPEHYGTTENALLEAMAMGIVPVVLGNPAERRIVDDRKTGLIVRSPDEFAEAIKWLSENPADRQKMGRQASESVRERFSAEKMEAALNGHYQSVMSMEKRKIVFSEIFGADPAEWFLSCQRDKTIFAEDGSINLDKGKRLGYGMFEKSKGTVFHFSGHFPDNLKLRLWAKNIQLLR